MLGLNIHSIIFFIFLGNAVSLVVYLIYISLYKVKESNINLYIFGKLLQSTTWLLYLIFENQLTGNMMTFINVFLFSGAAIEVYCMMQLKQGEGKALKLQLFIFTALGVILYYIFRNDVISRVMVTSLLIGTVFIYLFINLSFKLNKSKMQQVVGWIALLFALTNIFRGGAAYLAGDELILFSNNDIQIISGLFWVFVAFTYPLLFLFILKEKDNKRLRELNATKDKFFRIIGHDLKSPISNMIQLSQLIEEKYENLSDEKILKFIKAMNETSNQGYKLLENLLDWARAKTGSIKYLPTSFSVTSHVNENIELFNSQIENKNLKIKTNIKEDILYADQNMINTVIRNLLSNAIKFSHKNKVIEINGSLDKYKYLFSIRDYGVGMPCTSCENLFKLDHTESTLGTNYEKGTGIGLILCKEFIDIHNGKIWVESNVGEGSTFFFSIPSKNK